MNYLEKYGLEIIEVGNKKDIFAFTDYPLTDDEHVLVDSYNDYCEKLTDDELGKLDNLVLPMKAVKVISYDRDKYCKILYKNQIYTVKSGYLYDKKLRKIHLWDEHFTYETLGKKLYDIPYLYFKD